MLLNYGHFWPDGERVLRFTAVVKIWSNSELSCLWRYVGVWSPNGGYRERTRWETAEQHSALPRENGRSWLYHQGNIDLVFASLWCNAFCIWKGEGHPICPVMLQDARLATEFADEMLEKGIYVIGFSFPVVPKGELATLQTHWHLHLGHWLRGT